MSDLARVCWDVLRLRPPVMAWSLRTHETVFTASVELSGAEFSTDCSSVQGGCHSHQTGTRPGRAGGEAGQYVTKLLQPPAATNMKSKFEQVVQPVRPHNSACCTVPKQREATAVSHTHTPSTGPRGVTNMFQPTHSTTFSPHTSIPRISSDVRQSPARPPVTSQFWRTTGGPHWKLQTVATGTKFTRDFIEKENVSLFPHGGERGSHCRHDILVCRCLQFPESALRTYYAMTGSRSSSPPLLLRLWTTMCRDTTTSMNEMQNPLQYLSPRPNKRIRFCYIKLMRSVRIKLDQFICYNSGRSNIY